MVRKVLIVDKADPVLTELLEGAGFSCSTILNITAQQYIDLPDEYIGLVIRSKFSVDQHVIASKPGLKFIARLGAGMEHIDTTFASQQEIVCISTPEGNAPAVAQHALALLLNNLRHITEANQEVREGLWLREKNKGREIGSLTIGIIGFGNTGKAFVDVLSPFNPKILVYDKYKNDIIYNNVQEISLEYLLEQSDVISIHINYIRDNHFFFNKNIFEKMRKGTLLINTSRGAVLNTFDLLNAIDEGIIAHACLDVLEYENVNLQIPPKAEWDQTLMHLTENVNVTLTPHIAGQTPESEKRHALIAFRKIIETMNVRR
ncbi:MAG: serA 2 [Bacteroidetes bacterium]|nr:serA 2 [Bacteroidota bacterium]